MENRSVITVLENSVNILKFNEKIIVNNIKSLDQLNTWHKVGMLVNSADQLGSGNETNGLLRAF